MATKRNAPANTRGPGRNQEPTPNETKFAKLKRNPSWNSPQLKRWKPSVFLSQWLSWSTRVPNSPFHTWPKACSSSDLKCWSVSDPTFIVEKFSMGAEQRVWMLPSENKVNCTHLKALLTLKLKRFLTSPLSCHLNALRILNFYWPSFHIRTIHEIFPRP